MPPGREESRRFVPIRTLGPCRNQVVDNAVDEQGAHERAALRQGRGG